MQTSFLTPISERFAQSRWPDFWDRRNSDRPLLHIRAVESARFTETWPRPELTRKERDLIPEWQAFCARRRLATEYFLGDAIAFHQVEWGAMLTTLPVLGGGDYHYDQNGNAWIGEIPNLYDRPLPVFDSQAPEAIKITQCYDAIVEEVGQSGIVMPPLLTDGVTTLSSFRGAEQLVFDFLEEPETAKAWTRTLTTLFNDAYNYFFDHLGYGYDVCFGGPVAQGKSDATQCDFSVMLSPQLFEEFVAPEIALISGNYDYSLYHMDGVEQMRFLDQIQQSPNMRGIQWNPQPEYAEPVSRLDDLREIQKRGLCLMLECPSVEAGLHARDALEPEGLLLRIRPFDSIDEAEKALAAFQ